MMTKLKAKETMDVERLVTWALLDQGLGWAMHGDRGDDVAGFAELGTRIDTSGVRAPSMSLQSDDDALVVRDVILSLPNEAKNLVVQYGRIGGRPDWCEEGVGGMVQRKSANGKLAWMYEKSGDRRSPKKPIMEWQGWRPEQVEFWRSEYSLWWQALADMVAPLNRKLATHHATGPAAPCEPWNEQPPTIYDGDGQPVAPRPRPDSGVAQRRGYVEVRGKLRPIDN